MVRPAPASAVELSAQEIEAGLVYNFIRFTEWPPSSGAGPPGTLNLCIVGWDSLGNAFSPYEGRRITGREFKVQRHVLLEDVTAKLCPAVYLASSETRRMNTTLRALAGQPILTISGIDGFIGAGGMIQMVISDDYVRFDVHVDSAAKVGIRFNANMLHAARRRVFAPAQ